MKPSIGIDRFSGRNRIVEVAFHHAGTARENLPVRRDPDFDPGNRLSDGADHEFAGGVHTDHWRCLGKTVALENDEAGREKELVDLRRKRGAP